MSFIVESNSKPRQMPPFGTQLARLIHIVDLGTHDEEVTDDRTGARVKRPTRKVRFVWELPLKKAVFRESNGEEPFVVGRNFTLSLNKKATLSSVVEGIIGRTLADSERKSFDISKLLGEPSLLSISPHTKQDGSPSFKVGLPSPLMEGQAVPDPINQTVLYQVKEGRNDAFNSFPDWLKDEIGSSKEFAGGAHA